VLDVPAVQIEQEHRAEQRENQAACGSEKQLGDDPADQGAAEPEADRRVPRHRVGTGQRQAREASDDEAPDD
jgi:hypothetical protein